MTSLILSGLKDDQDDILTGQGIAGTMLIARN
jgi:hypothetical protein